MPKADQWVYVFKKAFLNNKNNNCFCFYYIYISFGGRPHTPSIQLFDIRVLRCWVRRTGRLRGGRYRGTLYHVYIHVDTLIIVILR